MSTTESNRPVETMKVRGRIREGRETQCTYEAIDIRIFGENLVKARDGGEEDDGIHVIEKGNPGSCREIHLHQQLNGGPLRIRPDSYLATRRKTIVRSGLHW